MPVKATTTLLVSTIFTVEHNLNVALTTLFGNLDHVETFRYIHLGIFTENTMQILLNLMPIWIDGVLQAKPNDQAQH